MKQKTAEEGIYILSKEEEEMFKFIGRYLNEAKKDQAKTI